MDSTTTCGWHKAIYLEESMGEKGAEFVKGREGGRGRSFLIPRDRIPTHNQSKYVQHEWLDHFPLPPNFSGVLFCWT
jgi:hypothetical protein